MPFGVDWVLRVELEAPLLELWLRAGTVGFVSFRAESERMSKAPVYAWDLTLFSALLTY